MKRTALSLIVCIGLNVAPAFAQNFQAAYEKARALAPSGLIDHAQAAVVLNAMAVALGSDTWGLLRKDGGNNCAPAGVAFKVSCDWLINRDTGQGCDFFTDAPGYHQETGAPVKGVMGTNGCHLEPSPGQWVRAAGAAPPPNVEPPAPPDWVAELLAGLADAEALLRAELAAIRKELAEIKARPNPEYEVDVLGRRVTVRPKK